MRISSSRSVSGQNGAILVLALVFVSIFLLILGGILTLVLSQNTQTLREVSWNRALSIAEAGIDYYRWHLAHDPTDFKDGTGSTGPILTLSEIVPTNYTTANLIVGDQCYIDETHTITNIPADYGGALWIKTANGDRNQTSEDFLHFTANREIIVHVAYSDQATALPNWLANSFTDTGDAIQVNAGGATSYSLYERKYSPGEIVLGANKAAGAAGNHRMYLVLVMPTDTYGPYLHDYTDPYGGVIGQFSLEITPPEASSTIVRIQSTGWTSDHPEVKRNILVRFGIQSLTKYVYLSNSNIWFGETEQVHGEVHSNGGIRMDGEGNARMTSARATYICGPEHGCNNEEKPGIWGIGENPMYWEFPVNSLDFDEITMDLMNIRDQAVAEGVYLAPTGGLGYHIVFRNNGSLDVYRVTQVWPPIWGYDGTNWVRESNSWRTHVFVQNYPIPDNGMIFVEDNCWVDGEVNGRATLAAGRFPDVPATNAKIRIQSNLTYYTHHDGSSALGLIAQKDVLIPDRSPDVLEIDAVLLAQKGHVFRYYYSGNIRSRIEVWGGVISNTIWTFSWVSCAGCPVVSGYRETETTYDPYLLYNPPPGFPTTGEYIILSWEELHPEENP